MTTRRKFIRNSTLIAAATTLPGAGKTLWAAGAKDSFNLPPLAYKFDALEPYIDRKTMEIHHGKHHAGYVRKLNAALAESDPEGPDMSTLEEILSHAAELPVAVRNNAGGHWNHTLFWKVMKPGGGGAPTGTVARMIDASFGSFENMYTAFNDAALSRFGSGWAWLVVRKGMLSVASTPNQDNPLMPDAGVKGTPVLGIDVWEHAYYLKYQNRRAEYVKAWWNLVNWEEVNRRVAGE